MKKGIIFSGGGTKIAGHAGYAAAFESKRLQFDYVAGVSAGAIISPFVAAGAVLEKADLFKNIKPGMFWKRSPFTKRGRLSLYAIWGALTGRTHLGDMSNLEKTLLQHFEAKHSVQIRNSGTRVFVESVALANGSIRVSEFEHFTRSGFIDEIVSSASIPVFADVESSLEYHADGGVRNHLPVKSLEEFEGIEELFVVFARPKELDDVLDDAFFPQNALQVLQRTLEIQQYEISKNDREHVRNWCLKNGVVLREFYMPNIMKSVYDTDVERQQRLYNHCFKEGMSFVG
jgi:predicted acylesterase/phospholipase RssA